MADMKRTGQPIAAEDAKEARPWRLPFWTEPPEWQAHKDRKDDDEANDEDSTETVELPTVEELESIRREAYNAGLEQGLVEGRQQGQQQGFQDGEQQGHAQGFAKGEQEGRSAGFSSGEAQGLEAGQAAIDARVDQLRGVLEQLQATLLQRDQQLPSVLVSLVEHTCREVMGAELKTGAEHIEQYVTAALQQLPSGKDAAAVFLSEEDAKHLSQSPTLRGRALEVLTDPTLTAGECRVETEHSLVHYSVAQHLEQQLLQLRPILLEAVDDFPNQDEAMPDLAYERDADVDVDADAESEDESGSQMPPNDADAAPTEAVIEADSANPQQDAVGEEAHELNSATEFEAESDSTSSTENSQEEAEFEPDQETNSDSEETLTQQPSDDTHPSSDTYQEAPVEQQVTADDNDVAQQAVETMSEPEPEVGAEMEPEEEPSGDQGGADEHGTQ